jgi:outer membrane receptor protein involved in Fe transport
MLRKLLSGFIALFLVPTLLLAQEGKIRGKVTDKESGEPLIGANVSIEGANYGASTDLEGVFVIINVPVGTYTLRASYVGYSPITVSNVRVNSDLSTEVNIALSSSAIEIQAVEIVSERPLINKNATGSVRVVDSEFFENLPTRGVNTAISLQPGVVQQGGNFYIRGGRLDETGFSIQGVPVTNIFSGGRAVSITDAALEQVQVLTGGYTAEYGGANSGLVRSDIRSGRDRWNFSLLGETDSYTGQGSKSLGGYSYGYRDITATAGGPLVLKNLKIFGSIQNTHFDDPVGRVWGGYDFRNVVTDAVFGVNHSGTAQRDTIDLVGAAGNVYGGKSDRTTLTGSAAYDFSSNLKVRVGGSYSFAESRNTTTTANIFNLKRLGLNQNEDGFGNVKITQFLNQNTFIEANVNYYFTKNRSMDPDFKYSPQLYFDSTANAAKGYTLKGNGQNWDAWSITLGGNTSGIGELPSFNQPGTSINGFSKNNQTGLGGRVDITSQVSSTMEVKAGGEFTRYTYRQYNPAGLSNWPTDFATLTGAALEKKLRGYNPNNIGYDVFGKAVDEDVLGADAAGNKAILTIGARHPVYGAGYVQSKIELQDIVLNLGLRYDYILADGLDIVNGRNVKFVDTLAAIRADQVKESPAHSYLSPRIGFSFPVTDRTVFYAQFGKFVQQPRLAEVYRGMESFYGIIKGGFFVTNTSGFGVTPMRTTSYEIGFQQQVSDNAAFDVVAFYKDILDQVTYVNLNPEAGATHAAYPVFTNGDFSTTKGLEFRLTLRRSNRIQAALNYTLSDAQGTGSNPTSQAGAWGAPGSQGAFVPKYISPTTFDQTHRGNISFDYRFEKGDGGPVLEQMGLNLLLQFNSGSHFTRVIIPSQSNAGDPRARAPIEPLGASEGPWFFQVDARLDKSFRVGPVDLNVFIYVQNLLGTLNSTGVFTRTGDPADDGWLGTAEGKARLKDFGTDEDLYAQMYRTFNGGDNSGNWGTPRQIRFGLRVNY